MNGIEIIVKGEPKEIAALVLAVQERQGIEGFLMPEEIKRAFQRLREQLLQDLGNQFMNGLDEKRKEERKVYLSEDARWGKAVFACLDKIAELAKEQPFTKETAETAKMLAETAIRLESAALGEETPNQ